MTNLTRVMTAKTNEKENLINITRRSVVTTATTVMTAAMTTATKGLKNANANPNHGRRCLSCRWTDLSPFPNSSPTEADPEEEDISR